MNTEIQTLIRIKKCVDSLNARFNKNHFSGKKMRPFKAAKFEKIDWVILCDDHYTFSDDSKFKLIKDKFPFPVEFDGIKFFAKKRLKQIV